MYLAKTLQQRWNFPSKHNPAHKNPALVTRVQALWEKNASQKEMLITLETEGFQINDRELMRLRRRFNWFLREQRFNGTKRRTTNDATEQVTERKRRKNSVRIVRGNGLIDQLADAILQDTSSSEDDDGSEEEGTGETQNEHQIPVPGPNHLTPLSEELDPAEVLRRQQRQQQLQTESDEKWRARKRRRRTRGWAGLPPDAPGEPPRFPSETTLDESKVYLNLDNKLYRQMRDQFQDICNEQGVSKKTHAGPVRWTDLLRRLVRANSHLLTVFQQEPDLLEQNIVFWRPKCPKTRSLDVICQDVTKRMRTMDSRMSLAEAKDVLNLNPEQTRQVRNSLLAILKADRFTSKFEAGDQRWHELKQRWIQESEFLRHKTTPEQSPTEAEHARNAKAIEALARDAMKRLRAVNTRGDHPEAAVNSPSQRDPGPGSAPSSAAHHAPFTHGRMRSNADNGDTSANTLSSTSRHSDRSTTKKSNALPPPATVGPDLQIDPSLLLAASDATMLSMHIPLQHEHQHQQDHEHENHLAGVPNETQHQPQHVNPHTPSHRPAPALNPHAYSAQHLQFLQHTLAAPAAPSHMPSYHRVQM